MTPCTNATCLNQRTKVPFILEPLGYLTGTESYPVLVTIHTVLIQTTLTNFTNPGWSEPKHSLKHSEITQGASLIASDRAHRKLLQKQHPVKEKEK